MRVAVVLGAGFVATGLVLLASCGPDGSGVEPTPGTELPPPAGGDAGGGGLDASEPSRVNVRFAHAAPALGSVDVCYRVRGTEAFEGPLFSEGGGGDGGSRDAAPRVDSGDSLDGGADTGALDDAGDGSVADAGGPIFTGDGGSAFGLSPWSMTNYFAFRGAGTFDIALVPALSRTCGNATIVGAATVERGRLTTVVLAPRTDAPTEEFTDAEPRLPVRLLGIVDDGTASPNASRVRFVHAAPHMEEPLIVRTGPQLARVTIAPRLEPRRVTSSGQDGTVVSPLGYVDVAPLADPLPIEVRPYRDGGSSVFVTQAVPIGLSAGAILTGIVAEDETGSPRVLLCNDVRSGESRTPCLLLQ